jgi:hypothetical protein
MRGYKDTEAQIRIVNLQEGIQNVFQESVIISVLGIVQQSNKSVLFPNQIIFLFAKCFIRSIKTA